MSEPIKPAVLIAVPHTGTVRAELSERLTGIIMKCRRKVGVIYERRVPHDHARNAIVARFLDTPQYKEVEWLLMCDSDIVPPFNILDMTESGKDVCAAFCQIKNWTTEGQSREFPVCLYWADDGLDYEYDPAKITGDLQKCDAVGTGCILIRRRVLEEMREAMKSWPGEKKGWFRFQYDGEGKMNKGEDFYFCERAMELGFEVWFDSRFRCWHFTTAII